MRVKIHRGAHEIGGSCVEVESGSHRIVLDIGRSLGSSGGDPEALPPVRGLAGGADAPLGVVITHCHQDHWGLAGAVPSAIPLYMGAATHRILAEAAFWTSGLTVEPLGHLVHREPFRLGPFRITPFLNDHSAFDAYSVLVEAEGRRLFYTGDVRGHGRKSAIFEELLRKPPRPVDVLLMEGTNIKPELGPDGAPQAESKLEDVCAQQFSSHPGLALVLFSALNIDRLVTLYRATLRCNRDFVTDLYTAGIAVATGNDNIPHPGTDWPRIHVYVPLWQRVKVKEAGAFDRVDAIKPYRLFEEDLVANPGRFVLKADRSVVSRLHGAGGLHEATALWSMWAGYLSEPSGQRLQALLAQAGVPLEEVHTSGHASITDLQRLAGALDPGRIVPIHSFAGHRFEDYFERVTPQADGEWWTV